MQQLQQQRKIWDFSIHFHMPMQIDKEQMAEKLKTKAKENSGNARCVTPAHWILDEEKHELEGEFHPVNEDTESEHTANLHIGRWNKKMPQLQQQQQHNAPNVCNKMQNKVSVE